MALIRRIQERSDQLTLNQLANSGDPKAIQKHLKDLERAVY